MHRVVVLLSVLSTSAFAQSAETTRVEEPVSLEPSSPRGPERCEDSIDRTLAALDQVGFLTRVRTHPDLVADEWQSLIDESIETLSENPLAVSREEATNPLWHLDEALMRAGELEIGLEDTRGGSYLTFALVIGNGAQVFTGNGPIFARGNPEG